MPRALHLFIATVLTGIKQAVTLQCNICINTRLYMIGYFSVHLAALGHCFVLRTAIFKLCPGSLTLPGIPEFVLAAI